MNSLSSNLFRAAALALALPVLGLCAAVQINGVCIDGNCTTPNAVPYGLNETGSTSSQVTLNTDPFLVTSSFLVGSTLGAGTYVDFYPVATYTGKGPSTGTDTITVDLLASITDPGASNWDGKYTEHIPLDVAAGSTATGQLFVYAPGGAHQGLALVSQTGPGDFGVVSESANLTGINGATVDFDYQFVFKFDPGTCSGCFDSSPAVPEPAETIPAALSLAGFALVALRRRKQ
jgi:hypothetical protein